MENVWYVNAIGGSWKIWGGSLMRKGQWTKLEDLQLTSYVSLFGERRWDVIAKASGLYRTGKSCRLRWVNYLQPGLKHGRMTPQEEQLILLLHSKWGNRWSRIAANMPGRTDNEIKNYWRTHMRKMAQERKRNSSTSSSSSPSSNFISFSRTRQHSETSSLKALLTDKEEEERLKEQCYMDQLWNEVETSELSIEICSSFKNYHLQECYHCNINASCDDPYSPQLMDQYYSSVWEECYYTESLKE